MSQTQSETFHFSHAGWCPACEQNATFTAGGPYFRSTLKCDKCKSAPRNRAIMHVLTSHFPQWREIAIHESSPGWDIVSQRLARECKNYTASQYDLTLPLGSVTDTKLPCRQYQVEDLEQQTFGDAIFDIVFMQDVFEHIFHPDRAIKEIARTLKPGGAVIMTVPIVMKARPSRRRARMSNGTVVNILPADFHGNPVSDGKSLVTIDWGYDIAGYLAAHSGLAFALVQIDNIDLGIRADLNDVAVGFKAAPPSLS